MRVDSLTSSLGGQRNYTSQTPQKWPQEK